MRPEGGPETSICVAGCGVVDLEPIAKELYGNSTTETIHVFVQGKWTFSDEIRRSYPHAVGNRNLKWCNFFTKFAS